MDLAQNSPTQKIVSSEKLQQNKKCTHNLCLVTWLD